MKWLDIYDIAICLEEKYPELDNVNISFPNLRRMIANIEGFDDDLNASNERILEAIQMAWIEERSDN